MPVTRLTTKNRGPTVQTTTITEPTPPIRQKGKVKALATETIIVTGGTLARLANKTRIRAETIVISENLARLCVKMRALATQTVTLSDSVARVKSVGQKNVQKTLEDTITIASGTLARLAMKNRPLALQTITIGGGTVVRLSTKTRALALQTVTVGGGTVARLNAAMKALAVQTVTVGGGTLARLTTKTRTRSETVVIAETRARLSTKIRALAAQVSAISDSVARTVAIQPKAITKTLEDTIIVTGGTVARLAAKTRTRSETVIIGENLLLLRSKIRALATQIVAFTDSAVATKTTGAKNITRALAAETIAISESITRLTAKIRALSTQIITINEARNRSTGKSRSLAVQSVTIADLVNRTVTTAIGIVRSITESVTIGENLGRLSTKRRALTTQITTITENIAKISGTVRAIPVQTVTVGGGSLVRRTQKIRAFLESITGYDLLEVFKNGIRLVPPQPPDKGGSGDSPLYPKGPRIKRILYPVYHVRERLRRERMKKLQETVIIPAFRYNIHKTVAPFIILNLPPKNSVIVKFAIQKAEPIHFTGQPIAIKIIASKSRKQAHKAKCASFVMNQKVIEGYGKKLNKLSKLMTLFLLAEEYRRIRR